jgi:hypothetical protein
MGGELLIPRVSSVHRITWLVDTFIGGLLIPRVSSAYGITLLVDTSVCGLLILRVSSPWGLIAHQQRYLPVKWCHGRSIPWGLIAHQQRYIPVKWWAEDTLEINSPPTEVYTSKGGLYLHLYWHHFTGRYLCWWAIPTFVLASLYW